MLWIKLYKGDWKYEKLVFVCRCGWCNLLWWNIISCFLWNPHTAWRFSIVNECLLLYSFAVIAAGCASCPKIKCERPGCDAYFCYHCKAEWHPNQTCDAARAQRSPNVRSSSVSFSQDSQHRKSCIGWITSTLHICVFAYAYTYLHTYTCVWN